MKERKRTRSMHYSQEYAKAMCDRMNALVEAEERKSNEKRKNSSKTGQRQQAGGTQE